LRFRRVALRTVRRLDRWWDRVGWVRKILLGSLALGPLTILLDVLGAGGTVRFIFAAIALVPLAWLIGEATEKLADRYGSGIGGFLNASMGNAVELIFVLLALNAGLTEVVRGSLAGSIAGNVLLVFGFALLLGGRGLIDRESTLTSLAFVAFASLLLLIVAIPSWAGDPDRRSLAMLGLPVAIVLLLTYVSITYYALRRHRALHLGSLKEDKQLETPAADAWSVQRSLLVLAVTSAVTGLVANILVHSIHPFAEQAHLSEFFIAAIYIATFGNEAAIRGKIKLAAEIALSASAQLAGFVIPIVAIVSWFTEPLALSFRPIEAVAIGGSVTLAVALAYHGYSSRSRGVTLIAAWLGVAAAFYLAGERYE
jgi:Ca2+:H+ antiporter